MAKIYKADGSIIKIQPRNGHDFKLDELRDIVGGYIEIVYLRNNRVMVVNECGKIFGLPFNLNATCIAAVDCGDTIVGDALVCKRSEIE